MDNNLKLLAVYEDLLKKIEEAMAVAQSTGRDGKDGKDGASPPDLSKQMFAMMATMHSDLMKGLISLEREVTVNPQVNVENKATAYTFNVERDNKGLINRVQAKPTNPDSIL